MIVQKKTTVGPGSLLTFQGGNKPVNLSSVRIYGRSVQSEIPSPSSPVPIVSVASGGTITLTLNGESVLMTVANGLKGIPVQEPQAKYLIGNGKYLTNIYGQKLMAL